MDQEIPNLFDNLPPLVFHDKDFSRIVTEFGCDLLAIITGKIQKK
jgi:hypothetical protein